MTRVEEIIKAAVDWTKKRSIGMIGVVCFYAGADWADTHPHLTEAKNGRSEESEV